MIFAMISPISVWMVMRRDRSVRHSLARLYGAPIGAALIAVAAGVTVAMCCRGLAIEFRWLIGGVVFARSIFSQFGSLLSIRRPNSSGI